MFAFLLPDPDLFKMVSYSLGSRTLIFEIRTMSDGAKCPDCGQLSRRIHSLYMRTVSDLPISGFTVVLHVQVRRFFCDNKTCARCTFTERMSGVIESYARRTTRMLVSQREVGFTAGGEAGAKIAHKLSLSTSPDTMIRMVRHTEIQAKPTPKILGIDDWALRKGHSYGTILVDLETREPVDLLPDRSSETVKKWLDEHPGVEMVSRDRSPAYIEAIHAGAPNAIQIADRWHLLHNMVEAVERVLTRRYGVLQEVFRKTFAPPESSENPTEHQQPIEQEEKRSPGAKKPTQMELQRQQVREKHRAQFDEIRRLHFEEGLGIRAICRKLRIGRRKVRKNLDNDQLPEYKRGKQRTILTPFWPYLEQRWKEGQQNGMVLWKEIKAIGFPGTYYSMARELVSLRKKIPKEKKKSSRKKKVSPSPTVEVNIRPFSSRQTAWLFIKDPSLLQGDKACYFLNLLEHEEEFQKLHSLVQQFWKMIGERKQADLHGWLDQAKTVGISELKYFANGLEKDIQAVEAALTYEWSNGPTEGHNNRLKMIKRQMYGRAKFDLLRQRVLYSS